MSLIQELRRRNVIRMAGLYLVGAWLVTQVSSTLLPAFEAPAWVLRAIIVLLAIGFTATLVFSWIYELTPDGLRRDADVPVGHSLGAQTGRRIDRAIIAVLLVALGYFAFDKFVLAPRRMVDAPPSVPAPHPAEADAARAVDAIPADASIAVLPFVNMSSDKEQEYFSDGLSEELLNQLAQVPQLRVIARTSSFSFKGKEVDVATIARALHVANVLEGSVRKSGNSLRITAQLIRAIDSSHLWSKTYDRELSDVFKVQDAIAGEVVGALKLTLLSGRKPSAAGRTTNVEAHNRYLRGLELASKADVDSYRRAIDEFQRAIELDPDYLSAYANMAAAQVYVADLTADPIGQSHAQQWVEKALSLSPGDPEVLAVRGWMRSVFLWDWNGARADFEAALAANPNDASAQSRYSWLLAALGRLPDAITAAQKAEALDPLADHGAVNLGVYLNAAGRYDAAREVVVKRLQTSAQDDFALIVLGQSLLLDGRPDEAITSVRSANPGVRLAVTAMAEHTLGHAPDSARALDELEKNHAAGFAFQVAQVHAWRGENGAAFDWLERAYSQRDGGMSMIRYDPFLLPLRGDPRYTALVSRLGLPQ